MGERKTVRRANPGGLHARQAEAGGGFAHFGVGNFLGLRQRLVGRQQNHVFDDLRVGRIERSRINFDGGDRAVAAAGLRACHAAPVQQSDVVTTITQTSGRDTPKCLRNTQSAVLSVVVGKMNPTHQQYRTGARRQSSGKSRQAGTKLGWHDVVPMTGSSHGTIHGHQPEPQRSSK